jgi:hypothetical protein
MKIAAPKGGRAEEGRREERGRSQRRTGRKEGKGGSEDRASTTLAEDADGGLDHQDFGERIDRVRSMVLSGREVREEGEGGREEKRLSETVSTSYKGDGASSKRLYDLRAPLRSLAAVLRGLLTAGGESIGVVQV